MIHAKVDVKLRDHERAHRAGTAMGTWTWGLLYVREHETDGFLPDIALRLAWAGEKDARKDAPRLVAAGLWAEADGGWTICKYDAKNETKAVIDERRRETRERVAKHRSGNGVRNALLTDTQRALVPGSGSGSGSGSDLSSERDREPLESPREPDPSAADFAFGSTPYHRARDVFSDAVSAATGNTFVLDFAPFTGKDLCAAMAHRPKGASLTQALAWLAPTVGEWVTSGEARPLTPRRFNDWLNERNAPKRPVSFVRAKNADRQPHDEGWLKRMREREAAAGTGTDDIFGGDS